NGALVQLPQTVSSLYEVWVRLVGKPASSVDVTTCATLQGSTTVVCSTDNFLKTRMTGHGQPSFTNATNQLLFLTNPLLTDTVCGTPTEPVFGGCLAPSSGTGTRQEARTPKCGSYCSNGTARARALVDPRPWCLSTACTHAVAFGTSARKGRFRTRRPPLGSPPPSRRARPRRGAGPAGSP